MNEKSLTFTDDLIATVAQLVQLGMLTGTEIYDHLATVRCVVTDDEKLAVCPEFRANLDAEIQRLKAAADSSSSALGFSPDTN